MDLIILAFIFLIAAIPPIFLAYKYHNEKKNNPKI